MNELFIDRLNPPRLNIFNEILSSDGVTLQSLKNEPKISFRNVHTDEIILLKNVSSRCGFISNFSFDERAYE